MKHYRYLLLLVSLLVSHQVFAAVISPNSVTASSTFSSYTLVDLINEDGLSGGLEGGLHGTDYFTMWLSNRDDVTPDLTFDMGQTVNFVAAYIWQYNYSSLNRGVDGFNILYSLDNISYTPLSSANLTKSPYGDIPAQVVPMAITARYIRFEVTSNHGDGLYTGLSEVAFSLSDEPVVSPPATPVPTTSQWALIMLSMLLGLMVFANRKRLF